MQNTPPIPPIPWEDVPGPSRLPLLGNALQIDRDHFHQQLVHWSELYGDVFALSIGRRRFLVVCDSVTIAKVLRDRPETFNRPQRLEQVSREFGFLGVFSVNGERWKRQRSMVLASLDPAHVKAFFPTLVTMTQRLAGRWRKAASTRQQIDLQADLMRYTVDVTAALAFGEDINSIEGDDALQRRLDKVLPALSKRLLSPFDFGRFWPTRARRELKRDLVAVHEAVRGFIAKARCRLEADPSLREHPRNLIQAMVARRDAAEDLSDEDVSGNVLTMLLGGKDTTANQIAWLLWLLARNPPALMRAQREAREVLAGALCADSPEQLARLEWIEACASEAMRLKPVTPLITSEAAKRTVVAGVQVEAGDAVISLTRAPAMAQQHFDAADQFLPARWMTRVSGAARGMSCAKRVVMSFGAGPRMCPGRYLAISEIKMATSMLLANFHIDWIGTLGGAQPEELLQLTMAPVGLKMNLSTVPVR